MTLIHLYPPIALATILAAFWALGLHRLYYRDLQRRSESFLQIIWTGLPVFMVGGYFWWRGLQTPLDTHLDLLVAAIAGMGFGAVVVWLIQRTFFSGKHPMGHFIYCLVCLALLSFLLGGGFFIDPK